MNSQSNLEIAIFKDIPKEDTLEILYSLNQANTPEVGSLCSIDELKNLIELSALNFFLLDDEKIVGFIICFKEGSAYHSLNYKFFSDSENKFLYIDRVVIKKEYRRMGTHLEPLPRGAVVKAPKIVRPVPPQKPKPKQTHY